MININFKYFESILKVGIIENKKIDLPIKSIINLDNINYLINLVCFEEMYDNEYIMLYRVNDIYGILEEEFYLIKTEDYPKDDEIFGMNCIELYPLGVDEYAARKIFRDYVEFKIS